MKKLIAILLVMATLFAFAACTGTPTENPNPSNGGSKQPVVDSFKFNYNGVEIALNAPAEPIVAALGEAKSYTESTSCAFDGLDKQYGYGSFYLKTYPLNGKDYIYGWDFVDDMIENNEGICIGTSKEDVDAVYGADAFNGSNAYTVTKGSGKMTIILENDVVVAIQYVAITE